MFYAAGNIVIWNSTGKIVLVQPAGMNVAEEGEEAIAQGVPWTPGPVQDLEAAEVSSSSTGEITIQRVTRSALELITNSIREKFESLSVPSSFQTNIESDAATVTGLVTDQEVVVGVTQQGQEATLTQVTGATVVSEGTFKVSADTITFNAGDFADGTQITGVYFRDVARTVIKGRSTAGELGNLSFFGKILGKPENAEVYIPKFTITKNYTLPLIGAAGDDITSPTKLLTDTDNGFNHPYEILYTDAA